MQMTQLLQQAFEKARQLPDEQQDALAQRILDNLVEEEWWDEAFQRTTDEQWEQLTRQVRDEIAAGGAEPLEDLLR